MNNDIVNQVVENMERLRQQVYVDGSVIVINVAYEYNIDIHTCNTAQGILHWVWHLTEKTWITPDVLRRFIEVACGESGIDMARLG